MEGTKRLLEYLLVIFMPKLINRVFYIGRVQNVDGIEPFMARQNENRYQILLKDFKLYDVYNRLFQVEGYSGNGYCWEGHIIQIFKKEDKTLLQHISFYPEADNIIMGTSSVKYKDRALQVLNSVFSNHKRLKRFIKSADWTQIDE